MQPKRDAAGRLAVFERQTLVNRNQGGLSLSLSRPGEPATLTQQSPFRPATRLEHVEGSVILSGDDQYRKRSRRDGLARRPRADGSRRTAPTCIGEIRMHSCVLRYKRLMSPLFTRSMTPCRENRFTPRSISTLRCETAPRTAVPRASCLPTLRRYPISAMWRLPPTFARRKTASSRVHLSGDAPNRRAGEPRLSAGVLSSRHRSMLDRKVERARSAPSTSTTCSKRRM